MRASPHVTTWRSAVALLAVLAPPVAAVAGVVLGTALAAVVAVATHGASLSPSKKRMRALK